MILIIYISIYLYSKLRLEKIFAQNIKSTYMILLLYLYIKEFFWQRLLYSFKII